MNRGIGLKINDLRLQKGLGFHICSSFKFSVFSKTGCKNFYYSAFWEVAFCKIVDTHWPVKKIEKNELCHIFIRTLLFGKEIEQ